MSDPQSRNETILQSIINGTEYTAPPQSRIEDLLIQLSAAVPNWDELAGDVSINLLPNITPGTYESNGVTYTVGSDGKVTANGTASATKNSIFNVAVTTFESGETYWLSGCPSGGTASTYFITCGDGDVSKRDYGAGVQFTASEKTVYIQIIIPKGSTVTNLVFTPMFTLLKHKGQSYTPHVPTNEEIKETIKSIAAAATDFADFQSKISQW